MIINNSKDFKEICKTILLAIDNSEQTLISETLELVAENDELVLSVTNRDYFVSVKMGLVVEEPFRATVAASLFLKLVSQLTSNSLELVIEENSLVIRSDGTYKFPLIYRDSVLLELPKIELNNITNTMSVSSDTLNSILLYNSKEIQSAKVIYKPVQKMYYIDDKGAITFTTGACVNNFELPNPTKVLLSGKVVKLFKLFADKGVVKFEISNDINADNSLSTRVRFSTTNICLTAITPSDPQLIESVPVDAIRNMSNKNYEHSVVIDRQTFSKILSRLLLFKTDLSTAAEFIFNQTECLIKYCDNEEIIPYTDNQPTDFKYKMWLNIETLKTIVDSCLEDYLTINFGDNRAVVLVRSFVRNIIPEMAIR